MAVVRFFEKGFVVINASAPAQDIYLDLAEHSRLKGREEGVAFYFDHFSGTINDESSKCFDVPAPFYHLAGAFTNSARVYSYLDAKGRLVDSSSFNTQ